MYNRLAKVAREKKERERQKRMAMGLSEEEEEPVVQTVDDYYEERCANMSAASPLKIWADVGGSVRKVTTNGKFSLGMNIIIIIAGILVGIGTYNGMEEDPTIAKLDTVILVIFTIECILKICAYGFVCDNANTYAD